MPACGSAPGPAAHARTGGAAAEPRWARSSRHSAGRSCRPPGSLCRSWPGNVPRARPGALGQVSSAQSRSWRSTGLCSRSLSLSVSLVSWELRCPRHACGTACPCAGDAVGAEGRVLAQLLLSLWVRLRGFLLPNPFTQPYLPPSAAALARSATGAWCSRARVPSRARAAAAKAPSAHAGCEIRAGSSPRAGSGAAPHTWREGATQRDVNRARGSDTSAAENGSLSGSASSLSARDLSSALAGDV